jgi:predicted alpha/beta-fold hydrolase
VSAASWALEEAVAAVVRFLRRWRDALCGRAAFPTVTARGTAKNLRILGQLSASLRRRLRPSAWVALAVGQLATVLGALRPSRVAYTRQVVGPLADGGTVGLDWVEDPSLPPDAPVVLLCHGLNGSSRDAYIKQMVHVARGPREQQEQEQEQQQHQHQHRQQQPGGQSEPGPVLPRFRVVAFNMRGCGGMALTSPRGYSAADTGDLAAAIEAIEAKCPGALITAAGFSLGGNLLCKYLGEVGAACPLAAAVSVSNPFKLDPDGPLCYDTLGDTKPTVAQRAMSVALGLTLRHYVLSHGAAIFPHHEGLEEAARAARTLGEFDRNVSAPSLGYRDIDDYYSSKSSLPGMGNVGVPLLVVHALDDPLIHLEQHVFDNMAQANPHITAVTTTWGGHIGWAEGLMPLLEASWAEKLAVRFLHAHVADKDNARHSQHQVTLQALGGAEKGAAEAAWAGAAPMFAQDGEGIFSSTHTCCALAP